MKNDIIGTRIQKADFSGVDIWVLLEIETRGQFLCIVLGPMIICVPIVTIRLQSDILND